MEPRLTIVTLGVSDLERSKAFSVTATMRTPMRLYGCGRGR